MRAPISGSTRLFLITLAILSLPTRGVAIPSGRSALVESEAEAARIAEISAALVVQIAGRVSWPSSAFPDDTTALAVCVVGNDPIATALMRYAGRESQGRRIVVRQFSSVQELEYCAVLFVSGSERDRLPQLLQALASSPVLSVSYLDQFCEGGGGIRIVKHTNRMGFEINPGAIRRAGMVLDPSLQRLASKVKRN